jgi:ATP-dependent protease ClpP protease subunit
VPSRTSRYRENHKRAIYVFGEINEDLLHRLTPQINELRCVNQDPITVYIDSIGGAIPVAERLRGL